MRRQEPRALRFEGETAFVPLSQGLWAVIDAADAYAVDGRNWYAVKGIGDIRYAATNTPRGAKTRPRQLMHRLILAAPKGAEVDHINGDGLDNRRGNLRLATSSQQKMNTRRRSDNASGFKGVSWHTKRQKWRAVISAGGETRHLGYFNTPGDAAQAYAEASARLHGEFARTPETALETARACLARMRGLA